MPNPYTEPIVDDAGREEQPRGVFTSEFVLTLLIIVGTFALVLTGHLDPLHWVAITSAGGAAYAISRGIAKS